MSFKVVLFSVWNAVSASRRRRATEKPLVGTFALLWTGSHSKTSYLFVLWAPAWIQRSRLSEGSFKLVLTVNTWLFFFFIYGFFGLRLQSVLQKSSGRPQTQKCQPGFYFFTSKSYLWSCPNPVLKQNVWCNVDKGPFAGASGGRPHFAGVVQRNQPCLQSVSLWSRSVSPSFTRRSAFSVPLQLL